MRKIALLFGSALLVSTLFVSCSKIKEALTVSFDMTSADIHTVIPAGSGGSFGPLSESIALNVDSIITANGGNTSNLQHVYLTSLTVHIDSLSDATNNLHAVSSIMSELSSDTAPTFEEIANLPLNADTSSAATKTDLNIPVNSTVDLVPYFHASMYNYRVSGATSRTTTVDLPVTIIATYHIVVGAL